MDQLNSNRVNAVIAHVVYFDRVAYSLLPIETQVELVNELNEWIRLLPEFQQALARNEVIALDTGDGQALIFQGDPQVAATVAVAIVNYSRAQEVHKLRVGMHSGPVVVRTDIMGKPNATGAGIDIAARIQSMAEPDALYLSEAASQHLHAFEFWRKQLVDLGQRSVKHEEKLRLFVYHPDGFGELAPKTTVITVEEKDGGPKGEDHRTRSWPLLAGVSVAAVAAGVILFSRKPLEVTETVPGALAPQQTTKVPEPKTPVAQAIPAPPVKSAVANQAPPIQLIRYVSQPTAMPTSAPAVTHRPIEAKTGTTPSHVEKDTAALNVLRDAGAPLTVRGTTPRFNGDLYDGYTIRRFPIALNREAKEIKFKVRFQIGGEFASYQGPNAWYVLGFEHLGLPGHTIEYGYYQGRMAWRFWENGHAHDWGTNIPIGEDQDFEMDYQTGGGQYRILLGGKEMLTGDSDLPSSVHISNFLCMVCGPGQPAGHKIPDLVIKKWTVEVVPK
jgi:hypothetical protein